MRAIKACLPLAYPPANRPSMGTEAGEEVWPLAVEVTIGLAVADESFLFLCLLVILEDEDNVNYG